MVENWSSAQHRRWKKLDRKSVKRDEQSVKEQLNVHVIDARTYLKAPCYSSSSLHSQQWADGLNKTAGATLLSFISRVSICRVYFQLLCAGLLVSYTLGPITERIFWQVSCGVSSWHLRLVKKTATVCRITASTVQPEGSPSSKEILLMWRWNRLPFWSQISLFFFFFTCSWHHGEVNKQAAVCVRPSVWALVDLLRGPDDTVEQSHADTHIGTHAIPVPVPQAADRSAKGQTGWIPAETQRGSGWTFLQGRVGNHLWRRLLDNQRQRALSPTGLRRSHGMDAQCQIWQGPR